MGSILELKNVFCGYDGEYVLKDVSFSISEGEFVGIIGPNGCGKTTLFRTITKVLNPKNGSILYKDKDIKNIHLKDLAKEIAVVLQVFEVTFSYTVEEFVLMGRFPHKNRFETLNNKDFEIVKNSMKSVDIYNLKDKKIQELSGGEIQKVQIAQAISQEPKLLLLDEPTSHLDIKYQVEILDLIKRLNKEKKISVVIIFHDLNLASEYCEKLILLNSGKIHKIGEPSSVLTYQIIEEVYRTVVIVNENPVSKKPCVFLVPEDERKKNLTL